MAADGHLGMTAMSRVTLALRQLGFLVLCSEKNTHSSFFQSVISQSINQSAPWKMFTFTQNFQEKLRLWWPMRTLPKSTMVEPWFLGMVQPRLTMVDHGWSWTMVEKHGLIVAFFTMVQRYGQPWFSGHCIFGRVSSLMNDSSREVWEVNNMPMMEMRWLCRQSLSLRRAETDRLVVQSRTMLDAAEPGHNVRLGTLLAACGRRADAMHAVGLPMCCVWSPYFSRRFVRTSVRRYDKHHNVIASYALSLGNNGCIT